MQRSMMIHRSGLKTLAAGTLLATICLTLAGCHSEPGGPTVPAPPRELVEKSYRMGKAPIANPPPGGANTGGPAAAPR